jgi:molybdopterin-guanine dinucleotide biosynthesis protein A
VPSAAILAGGAASRFGGRDKGALVIGGRSIRDRQIAELAALTDDILVVGHGGEPAGVLPPGGPPVRFVPDRVAGCGPLGGLDAALAAARDDTLVVVACDMPFVTRALLEYLASCVGDADAAVPFDEHGPHPLCAAYARGCRGAVACRLEEGRLAVRGLLDDLRVRIVSGPELALFGDPRGLLANVNTADEYREWLARSSA